MEDIEHLDAIIDEADSRPIDFDFLMSESAECADQIEIVNDVLERLVAAKKWDKAAQLIGQDPFDDEPDASEERRQLIWNEIVRQFRLDEIAVQRQVLTRRLMYRLLQQSGPMKISQLSAISSSQELLDALANEQVDDPVNEIIQMQDEILCVVVSETVQAPTVLLDTTTGMKEKSTLVDRTMDRAKERFGI